MKKCYLFGYGSLICSESRSITCPELCDRSAIPVLIHGLERTWSKRTTMGMTAMGVRFRSKARCAGILVPLYSEDELKMFDKRELGYRRVRVDPDKVDRIPFLDKEPDSASDDDENDADYSDFFNKQLHSGVDIWVYVPEKTRPPTKCHPIAQSYVDTILRGCLATGGEELCAEFLETTTGWHPEEWDEGDYCSDDEEDDNDYDDSSDDDEEAKKQDVTVWVNDRSNPVYRRGDPQHSRKNAQKFDRLIRRFKPDYFPLRKPLQQQQLAKN